MRPPAAAAAACCCFLWRRKICPHKRTDVEWHREEATGEKVPSFVSCKVGWGTVLRSASGLLRLMVRVSGGGRKGESCIMYPIFCTRYLASYVRVIQSCMCILHLASSVLSPVSYIFHAVACIFYETGTYCYCYCIHLQAKLPIIPGIHKVQPGLHPKTNGNKGPMKFSWRYFCAHRKINHNKEWCSLRASASVVLRQQRRTRDYIKLWGGHIDRGSLNIIHSKKTRGGTLSWARRNLTYRIWPRSLNWARRKQGNA